MSLLELLKERDQRGKIYGVAVGIVTNNKDPEGMGRVKLKFPWRDVEDESYWARIATLMAGKGRGAFFLPEVGEEVLVAFDQGDIHHPYVLGGLWNGKDEPPEKNADGKNNIRIIKSRSGHEIIFNDNHEDKKEQIMILTKAGHQILLDDSAGGEKIEIRDKTGNNTLTMDSVKNSISISSQTKLSIKSQMIEIESGGMMTIKAGATLTLKGAIVKIN